MIRRFPFIKKRYYLRIICIIFVVVILITGPKNTFSDSLSPVARPTSFPSLLINLLTSSPSSMVTQSTSSSSSMVSPSTSFPFSVVNLSISSSSSWIDRLIAPPSSTINPTTSSPFSLVNLSTSSQSSFVTLSHSYLINPSFRNELINQRLTSYSLRYENSSSECNISKPLTAQQNQSFPAISKSLDSLRQQIVPYPNGYFHGRGIVFTVGQSQLTFVKANLKILQLTNTRLPVQIWYSSTQIAHKVMMNLLAEAPKLNISGCCFDTNECRTSTQTWQLDPTHVYKPRVDKLSKPFPYKPAAIISATFAEVLFLDSDAYVTRDPEDLFLSDPMYLKFGALFYPDVQKSRQHPLIWKILNTSCILEEYELDSATILVDKKRVWNGLYFAKLMNDNHKIFYKHVTSGDKDTFRLGFRYMNVKYYLVMIPCATGSFDGNHFCGKALCKTDSLGQHIYINHIHILKYEGSRYTKPSLEYTRIGLGDPNNNSLSFVRCSVSSPSPKTCFYITKNSNLPIDGNPCSPGKIPSEEIEDHQYTLDESLLFDKSRDNRVLISKTNNLIPNFLDNLLQYINSSRRSNLSIPRRSIQGGQGIGMDRRSSDNIHDLPDRLRLMNRVPRKYRDVSIKP